jgi:Holliday junction resolvasome RuvABC endonuclease subunit
MLTMPVSIKPFTVLAFDPGSSHLGIAILDDLLDGSKKIVRHAFTEHLRDTHPGYTAFADLHGSRQVRLMILRDTVTNMIRTIRPNAVIVESNYKGRFVNAFAALVECVAACRSALFEVDPFAPLYLVDPTTVKINAGMKKIKGTDKEDVRRAARARTDIEWWVPLEDLDEHAVDASMIGLYYLTDVV